MFPKIIDDIVGAGMTEAEIGKFVGRSQPSVNRMRRGESEPTYTVGVQLVELHKQLCTADGRPRAGRVA